LKRAALYIRVSTIDQHPETQLLDQRQFAVQRGLQIAETYTDHGVSGTKARRPALDKMMEDARRHKFDVVVVWACDRLARSTKHLLQVLDELNGFGIQFLSQREAIDTEGPLGGQSS
jgi:DNA invertase Pin-like site-specific DNA recombinase